MNNYPVNQSDKKTVRLQAPLGERVIITELSEDLELPDYQPEIKRLLRVQAKVSPADCYIGAGTVECSGTVEYSILYSGTDGALYCAAPSGAYRFSFPVELPADFDAGEGLLCDVDNQAETVSGRVTAPRKLTLRCRLRSRTQLRGTRVLTDPTGSSPSVQRLIKTCDCARLFSETSEPFTLGDEVLCDPNNGMIRVICADAQVFVSETTAGSGAVQCRGEVCLKLLCCREETGEIETIRRRVPFDRSVEVDGVAVNCETCATGNCGDLRVTVEDGKISCDVTVALSICAVRNESQSFLRDAYSTEAECSTEMREIALPVLRGVVLGNMSLNRTLSAEEVEVRSGAVVVDTDCTVIFGSAETERGKVFLNGKCRFRSVLSEGGDWSVQEVEIPVRYETSCEVSGQVQSLAVTAEAISCRARIDGETLSLDAEIALSGTLFGEETIQVLSGWQQGAERRSPAAVYTVCYPTREDTLWSVAKRYHTEIGELSAKNSLAQSPSADASDSLDGVRYLLI